MNLITQKTAELIWNCYREIKAAEQLLGDMESAKAEHRHDPHAQKLKDAFGRSQDLQLGIPSGQNSHRLFNVSPKLAGSVIRAHIATKNAALVEANEKARIELNGPVSPMHPIKVTRVTKEEDF